MDQPKLISIAWYKKDQWDRIRAVKGLDINGVTRADFANLLLANSLGLNTDI